LLSPSLDFKVGAFAGWFAREAVLPAMSSILSILFILSKNGCSQPLGSRLVKTGVETGVGLCLSVFESWGVADWMTVIKQAKPDPNMTPIQPDISTY